MLKYLAGLEERLRQPPFVRYLTRRRTLGFGLGAADCHDHDHQAIAQTAFGEGSQRLGRQQAIFKVRDPRIAIHV